MRRHCLVTGGNRGIGLAICRALVKASKDNIVWLCARNAERAQAELLHRQHEGNVSSASDEWDGRVRMLQLDVTDQASVETAARRLREAGVQVDLLVNNAGVAFDLPWNEGPPTPAMCDKTIEVNVRGVQRVFHAMQPLLAKDARVVNVSSGAGPLNMEKTSKDRQQALLSDDLTEETLDALVDEFCAEYKEAAASAAKAPAEAKSGDGEHASVLPCASPSGWWLQAYGFSKAAVNALTRIWARDNPALLVACCTPGLVDTGMVADYKGNKHKKTPEQGAATPVWLSTAPRAEITSGAFYGNDCKLLSWIGYSS